MAGGREEGLCFLAQGLLFLSRTPGLLLEDKVARTCSLYGWTLCSVHGAETGSSV